MPFDPVEYAELERSCLALERELQDPELARDPKVFSASARRLSELARLLAVQRRLKKILEDLRQAKVLLADQDPGIRAMAQSEIDELAASEASLEEELRALKEKTDPNDAKNTIVEIRAGAGGN
ncbi:MAG: PCRF domain-containing protein, partial [Deltaproteobacteria bacterium]|nr:PCRF domain-containing protein [Deltaproteobacteria bacterium]